MNIEQLKNLRSGTILYHNRLYSVPDVLWLIKGQRKPITRKQAKKKFDKVTFIVQTNRSSYTLNGEQHTEIDKSYLIEIDGKLFSADNTSLCFEHEIDGLIDEFMKEQKQKIKDYIQIRESEMAKLRNILSTIK